MTGSWLIGVRRLIPYALLTLALMPLQAAALALDLPLARRLPQFYHRRATRLLGLDVVTRGAPSTERPTLFVANHSSYFDIEALASLADVSFIAKAEMSSWPFFGWLAKLQRCVFVDRRPSNVGAHASEIGRRLAAGDSLVLFAEGTTSDGNRLLPFKSALFSVAGEAAPDRPLCVQPVSIVATALDGMALGRSLRPYYAWYGDVPLMPHMWEALCLGRFTIVVEFHPPFKAEGLTRKELARRCHAEVEAGFARAITGRYDTSQHLDDANDEEGDEIEAAA
jgi:1-acyl-sn-glycerol-3-phosphate acyltransferase